VSGLPEGPRLTSLLRQRNFGLLWFGGLVSFTGDWILFTGLPLFVFDLTGSTLSTAGVFAASMLPRIVWGSLAGVLVDRWDRRRTLVATNLVQAVGLLPLLLVDSHGRLWIVYAVAFFQASLEELATPAEGALLPRLVPEAELVTANALNSLNNNLARLTGPVIAGFTIVAAGLQGIAVLDAVSFLTAAGLIAAIRVTPAPASRRYRTRLPGRSRASGDSGSTAFG